ncbi:hypothetical protein [Gulosibacter sp. 10]|uniref:hypothetical protein n=1 Tax=Gulosibacter sp. 10 TaxID=1255570 RepID=UPI00097EE640|nr:hypothetical protein [Gulosibacter sp. 10]SJM64271.1 hypothetical protein FM112_10010 [Gulosibacter sp. 10]
MRRGAWLWAQGWAVLPAGAVLAALILSVPLAEGLPDGRQRIVLLGIIAIGAPLAVLGHRAFGVPSVRRAVERERTAWAAREGWRYDGPARVAPELARLGRPHGRRDPVPEASMHGTWRGRPAFAQTWMLRSAVGSTRLPARREVVAVAARTGPTRLVVTSAGGMPVFAVIPAWAHRGRDDIRSLQPEGERRTLVHGDADSLARHGDAVRSAADARAELPYSVVVGEGLVMILAFDDPRGETVRDRLDFAARIAELVERR